jgi:hypothetical protein
MPLDFRPAQGVLDPLLRWLAFDGWGFHEGFFHWQKYVAGRTRPKSLKGYERRVFDQGLGRSLWFVNGGNPELIERTILGFNKERHSDMWSGIGLAATYAGFASAEELRELPRRAGKHQAAISQGAVFAAKARDRAGNSTAYTEMAAQILCGMSASEAAHLSDVTLEDLDSDDATSYESWRLRIQERFATESKLEEVLA